MDFSHVFLVFRTAGVTTFGVAGYALVLRVAVFLKILVISRRASVFVPHLQLPAESFGGGWGEFEATATATD
jgi:hypothetical protein